MDTIDEKIEQWTEGLDEVQSRISIYNHIRDIPFGVVPRSSVDYRQGLEQVLNRNVGSCSPKHFLLGEMYDRLSIPVKYATYPFYWDELGVEYPPHIKKLADEMPLTFHLACKPHIDGKDILLDSTWDTPLKKAGFTVNEDWNGYSDTSLSVTALEEIVHENIWERFEYLEGKMKKTAITKVFFEEFNKWLMDLRREPGK